MARMTDRTDAEIQTDVLHELRWDTRIDETDIGVQAEGGIVTLTGQVPSYAARIAAQEAAFRVDGVTDVANDLRIVLPGSHTRSDTDLAQTIRQALEWDVLIASERIHCSVTNGWVTLQGEVDSWSQRLDVERAIGRLSGVRGVTNHIAVHPGPVSSSRIRELIGEALERRAERETKRITITVDEGIVTVRGSVQTWQDKRAVLGVIEHAPGVLRVDDELGIDPYG